MQRSYSRNGNAYRIETYSLFKIRMISKTAAFLRHGLCQLFGMMYGAIDLANKSCSAILNRMRNKSRMRDPGNARCYYLHAAEIHHSSMFRFPPYEAAYINTDVSLWPLVHCLIHRIANYSNVIRIHCSANGIGSNSTSFQLRSSLLRIRH